MIRLCIDREVYPCNDLCEEVMFVGRFIERSSCFLAGPALRMHAVVSRTIRADRTQLIVSSFRFHTNQRTGRRAVKERVDLQEIGLA